MTQRNHNQEVLDEKTDYGFTTSLDPLGLALQDWLRHNEMGRAVNADALHALTTVNGTRCDGVLVCGSACNGVNGAVSTARRRTSWRHCRRCANAYAKSTARATLRGDRTVLENDVSARAATTSAAAGAATIQYRCYTCIHKETWCYKSEEANRL